MNRVLPTATKPAFTPVQTGLAQGKCGCNGPVGGCQECSKPTLSIQRSTEESETQKPMAISTFMEGHSFDRVRIHDSEKELDSTMMGGAFIEPEEGLQMVGGNGDGLRAAPTFGSQPMPLNDAGAPPAITASTSVTSGPTYNNCGTLPRFRMCANFTTSMRNGWVVQKVENTWNATNCDGTAYGGPVPTVPRYWEAWQVDGSGNVTPVDGICSANDRWERGFCDASIAGSGCANKNSSGSWSMAGTLYAVTTLPAGFSSRGVTDAGVLQSTTSDPGAALGSALSTRARIGGTWNCCPPNNSHTRT